ncbi:MAG: MBL fold metallo-hydrolase [Firmicutes bacterium HGW-Firmicutes-15]|nr:MAG: MBL fold metallo-hydrolase [Firmicutes bacterium HGW-Firmicutes-15]
MQALKIRNDVHWVGVQDPDLKVFDIVMTTELGTTYNAYLIKGAEKTVLIETVKERFFAEYIEDLEKVVKLQDIDYLIMNHTEPDHAGSVEKLLQKIPGLTILGSPTALKFLKEITNSKFASREVHQDDELDLGGKTLKFISAPFLHWPDSMYTYLQEDQVIFTCDSFGSHYADPRVFNDLIEKDITPAFKNYFDDIMGPFKPYVLEAMDKIKDLPIEVICPGHGPVIRQDIQHWIDLYREWATPAPPDEDPRPKIVLAYVTAYGYTEMIAEGVMEGLEMVADFNVKKYNLIESTLDEVMADIASADGLLIGSPTLNGDTLPPVWELLVRLSPISHAHLVAAAFGAYGWSGEAVPNIESRLRSLRMQVLPGLKINFRPSARNLEDAFQFGMDFGKAILETKLDKSKKKWRCLVCGQVFEGEEAPEVCPACGVSQENFVPEKMEDEFINDSSEKFLLIGGGIAALSAAAAIRKRNRSGKITILTEEAVRPYYRPALSDFLSADIPDERLYVYNDAWYEENQIEVQTSCRVISLDTKGKNIVLENGDSLGYDKLIMATGARSNIPPFKGVNQQGVFALRNLADGQLLKEGIRTAKKAIVIGGGVLGLEAVEEMVAQGLKVAVVEHFTRIMPRQLDEPASLRLHELIRDKGVQLYLGLDTEEILGDGRVTGVRLNNGEVLEADLVLLSTGVKPNVELAMEAGLQVDRGIVVDSGMRSSTPDVYAAGDVAQFGDRLIGLWPVSLEMGKIAGATAAGDWVEYVEPILSTMLAAFDREIFSVGEVNLPLGECRVIEVWDPVENFYKKSFVKDGVLVGVIIIAPKVNTGEALKTLGRDESGKKRANHWKCRVCGYIHEGAEPPDECPVCGAPKEMFDPVY